MVLMKKKILLTRRLHDFAQKELRKKYDVIILALGEQPHAEGFGNISEFELPKEQQALVDAAKATGKPVVLLMIAARPLLVTEAFADASAFLWAGLPGIQGGEANDLYTDKGSVASTFS